ncbi:hypothetical protein FE3_027 [Escherichia phage vB_EcoS_fFiEco03]|uniref:hypothetical protein n=1 Tax=Escherichia phage vB_EcoS_fFiEco03 TaxID=2762427 RepID=UPI0018601D24|nr:hypothetical protein QCF70_gp28 [Escherichia phage vB_EcoS_fFiEco03]QNO11665.1 hypothetical protein FE3_027 [Escherichia phage vB_EcoS_fFiEco03]
MSLRPIVSKGYSQTRGSNIWRTEVQGGVPRQGRDTYFEPVPISVTLVVSSLGRQAFYSFLNNIDGGASSFIMPHDTGLGLEDHQVLITSDISDSTDDGKNWVITFTATAERTAIQEDTCLTKNLPDLFGCYGDCLGSFLKIYANYETTFPRIWSDEGSAGYPPINLLASTLDSRIVYDGPQVYYINRNGNLVQSAANEWPLTFIDGVAVGRVPPESTSSNILIKSSKLSDASWVKTRATVSDAVDGFLNGGTFSLVPTQTNDSHLVYQSVSSAFAEGDVYTLSYVAKAYGYNYARLRAADDAGFIADCVANLSTGVIYAGAPGSDIAELGDGWYRFTETVAIRQGGASSLLLASWVYNNSAVGSFVGDGVSGILVCAMQIEKSPFATSPIVTESSPVTRTTASAKVTMNGATSIDITYSDGSVINVKAVDGYASIPQADSAWGSKYITRIDFNVDG